MRRCLARLVQNPDDEAESLGFERQLCLKRVRSWRIPPNWSWQEWYQEMTAVAAAAAFEALNRFDSSRGVALERFGYGYILGRCLARYRKEWNYALHSFAKAHSESTERSPEENVPEISLRSIPEDEEVQRALGLAITSLSDERRWLIQQLFWQERTEVAIAEELGANQSTISRRKSSILNELRSKLALQLETEVSSSFAPHRMAAPCNGTVWVDACGHHI